MNATYVSNRVFYVFFLTFLLAAFGMSIAGCSGSTPAVKPAPTPAVKVAKKEVPAWVNGEMPQEQRFYGMGKGPKGDDTAAAMEKVEGKAREGLKAELNILVDIIKFDHSEQVAEIISRYPLEEFNAHIDACAASVVEQAKSSETFEEKKGDVVVLSVLLQLEPEDLYKAIEAREGLPDEQKGRIRDYKDTFTQNAMKNLSR